MSGTRRTSVRRSTQGGQRAQVLRESGIGWNAIGESVSGTMAKVGRMPQGMAEACDGLKVSRLRRGTLVGGLAFPNLWEHLESCFDLTVQTQFKITVLKFEQT